MRSLKLFAAASLSLLGFASVAFGQVNGGVYPGPTDSAAVIAALGYTPVNKAGDTMTGPLAFSGTTNNGLRVSNLTTTQKNALTALVGNVVYDTTLGRLQGYDGAAWHSYTRLDGDTMLGDLLFTDGLYDIGKSGATRPRNVFAAGTGTFGSTGTFGGSLNATGSINTTDGRISMLGGTVIDLRAADGIATLTNNAGTGFTRLNLGGTTSSFPAWKRSGTMLAARLADDSADAQLTAKSVLGVTLTVATLPAASSNQGALAFVSDATLTAITGLGLSVTGGGANKVPVYSDGSNWIIL